MSDVGLVLSGGGARAAYQVGVLLAIADIAKGQGIQNPFSILSGVSAGAINAALLASSPDDFVKATSKMQNLWEKISSEQVFHSDILSLATTGAQWVLDLSLGGVKKSTPGKAFLETEPLHKLIKDNCDFSNIQKNIDAGKLKAIALSALDYETTSTVTFVQGIKDLTMWQRVRRRGEFSQIKSEHVMASAAIPLLFPPIKVDDRYFGDGSIRNQSPCSPALYLGAKKLIAVGVRKKQDLCFAGKKHTYDYPTAGRVLNVLLSAVMMDGLEMDMERIQNINTNLVKIPEVDRKGLSVREVDCLWIYPSFEIAEVANKKSHEIPRMIRYLLRGLGPLDELSEIASYLLFEPSYCQQLIERGFEDGMAEKDKIRKFIC
jgi:NTE family protein